MYVIDGKQTTTLLTKLLDVVSLGDTSSNQNVRIDFAKDGITLAAQNSAGTYSATMPVTPNGKSKVKTAIVAANVLLSYIKGRDKVTLTPDEDALGVASKGVKAKLFYVGSEYEVDVEQPTDGKLRLDKVTDFVNDALSRSGDMKDRVEQKGTILANFIANKDGHFFSIGDTHHAVLLSNSDPSKKVIDITMTTSNMRRIFGIGGHLSILQTRIVAVTDTEYLSLNATSDGEAVSVTNIRQLQASIKSKTTVQVDPSDLINALTSIAVGTDVGSAVTVSIKDNKISLFVSTGAAKATMTVTAVTSAKEPHKVSLNINQLLDCLRVMKGNTITLVLTPNIVGIKQDYILGDVKGTVFAAVSAIA